jgi:hypothetical protein
MVWRTHKFDLQCACRVVLPQYAPYRHFISP